MRKLLVSVVLVAAVVKATADDMQNLAAILRDMRKDVVALNMNVGYPGKFLEVPDDVTAKRVQKFVTQAVHLRFDGGLYDVGEESIGYVEAECAAKPTLYFGESKAEAMNENPVFFEQTNLVVEARSGVWRTPLPVALRYFRFKGEQPKSVRFIEEIADVKDCVPFSGNAREVAMRNAALRTLRLCMREFLIDGVKRDRLPWAGDLTISLLANAASYRDAEIVKRTLVVLDSAGWKAGDINGIVDYSLWHIISHDMFQKHFGDLAFLREQYASVAGRLESFADRTGESGLVDASSLRRRPTWLFIDWTGPESQSTTALNMIYFGALEAGARLADRLGENADAERWRVRASRVKAALKAKVWDAERGLFRSSVDESGAEPGSFTRHGNIYAVIFGVAGGDELKSIGAALAGEELPPVGTPYVAAYEASALVRCGRKADARRLVEKVWGGMLDAGATSFWEGFDAREKGDERWRFYGRPYGKSLCHAWSSAPVFLLPMLKEDPL